MNISMIMITAWLLVFRTPDGAKEIIVPGIASEGSCRALAHDLSIHGNFQCIPYDMAR